MLLFKKIANGLRIQTSFITDVGKKRGRNEDNYYVDGSISEPGDDNLSNTFDLSTSCKSGKFLVAVFDGVGGGLRGDEASYIAASKTRDYLRAFGNEDPADMLIGLCDYLNSAVFSAAMEHKVFMMGTTIAALYFCGKHVYSCNVGDSRCYRLRKSTLLMLSEDHIESFSETIGAEEKRKPGIVQYLGMDPSKYIISPVVTKFEARKGDKYLVCTDGLTDMVCEPDICRALTNCKRSSEAASELLTRALENGGEDNITVAVSFVI